MLYAACLAWLLPALSLWLDEILDLIGTTKPSLPWMIAFVRDNAGGVPLGYLVQRWSMQAFGVSAFAGRLPSALASLAGCVGVYALARQAGVRRPLLAVAFYALCPLQLRYAIEARGYSLALCLSVWATVAFFAERWVAYGVCLVAALYTLPLAIFVPAAHWLWAAARRDGRILRPATVAIGLAVLGFLPWYFYTAGWSQSVAEVQGSFKPGWGAISLILREMVGMGYVGTSFVLITAACGLVNRERRGFWLLYVIMPIAGALIADVKFGYFLSIRQMIFVLAPLAILFVQGVERTTRAAAVMVLAAALYADVSYLRRPREDWKSASEALAAEVKQGSCVVMTPPDSEQLYFFFNPALERAKCSGDSRRVAVAISPYAPFGMPPVEQDLTTRGYRRIEALSRPEPKIEIFEK